MELTITKLGSEDVSLARTLVKRFHGTEPSEEYLRGLLENRQNLLIAGQVGAEVAGFVWGHWLDRLRMECPQLFVYEVEVAPEHRRRGIGTRLMERVLAEATPAAADVFVFTNHSNEGAVAFYKALAGSVKNGDDLQFVWERGTDSGTRSVRS